MARGVWENGRVAFFDNRIVDADAPSYTNISWEAVANRAANAKKTKYNPAAEELLGTFTPLVCSTDGVLHREYRAYQIRLASRLATKWQRPYSVVMKWVKLRMQFAVFHAVDLRLRGTRRRILGLGLQDGAAIFAHQHWHWLLSLSFSFLFLPFLFLYVSFPSHSLFSLSLSLSPCITCFSLNLLGAKQSFQLWYPGGQRLKVISFSWSCQEYIRTRVGNSILWGLPRQNSKFVIDDAQPLSFQVVMHSTLNTCMLALSRSSIFLTGISG